MKPLTLRGFFIRWTISSTLLLLTINPTKWCYYAWLVADDGTPLSYKALVGMLVVVIFSFYWHACKVALGKWGIYLVIAVFAVAIWALRDYGWVDPNSPAVLRWGILLCVSTIMTLGMSWSHISRRMTGQLDVGEE